VVGKEMAENFFAFTGCSVKKVVEFVVIYFFFDLPDLCLLNN
jgi:hypothetical protein